MLEATTRSVLSRPAAHVASQHDSPWGHELSAVTPNARLHDCNIGKEILEWCNAMDRAEESNAGETWMAEQIKSAE